MQGGPVWFALCHVDTVTQWTQRTQWYTVDTVIHRGTLTAALLQSRNFSCLWRLPELGGNRKLCCWTWNRRIYSELGNDRMESLSGIYSLQSFLRNNTKVRLELIIPSNIVFFSLLKTIEDYWKLSVNFSNLDFFVGWQNKTKQLIEVCNLHCHLSEERMLRAWPRSDGLEWRRRLAPVARRWSSGTAVSCHWSYRTSVFCWS